MAQRFVSIYITRYFYIAKNTDSVPQTFASGGTNIPTKYSVMVTVMAIHATTTKK